MGVRVQSDLPPDVPLFEDRLQVPKQLLGFGYIITLPDHPLDLRGHLQIGFDDTLLDPGDIVLSVRHGER